VKHKEHFIFHSLL